MLVANGMRTIFVNCVFEQVHGFSFQYLAQMFEKKSKTFGCVCLFVSVFVVYDLTKHETLALSSKRICLDFCKHFKLVLKLFVMVDLYMVLLKVPGEQIKVCLAQAMRDFNCIAGTACLIMRVGTSPCTLASQAVEKPS
jgi:hypothetical protein